MKSKDVLTRALVLKGSWRAVPPLLAAREIAGLADECPEEAGLYWWKLRHSRGRLGALARPLRQSFHTNAFASLEREEQIARLVAAFADRGIESILIKGWAVARHYAHPGMRPLGDIDLCVPSAQLSAAMAVLARLDFPLGHVDLHQGIADLPDRTWEQVLARTQTVQVGGRTVRVPGAEDHLRLLCVHFLRHGGYRPLWLCDVAALLESLPADFDWAYFRSGSPRTTEWALAVIGLAMQLLGAEISNAEIAEGCTGILPAWLARNVAETWAEDATVPFRLRELWQDPVRALQALDADSLSPIVAGFRLRFSPQTRLPLPVIQLAGLALRTLPKWLRGLRRYLRKPKARPFAIHRRARPLGGILDAFTEPRLRKTA